jgi:RAD3-like DEAD/DEAH box helicase
MTVDFTKLDDSGAFDTEISPRILFDLLPDKDREKYKYPRDVQSEVMDQWLARRDEPNLLLKMNTGGGKTLVGLLLLKSSLNEGKGPAIYVSPTPYLAQQVTAEARGLGLEVVDEPRSPKFTSGRAILVTYIHRVINGKSVFGVGDEGIKIAFGTVVIDDAHACLETSEMQFSLTTAAGTPVYDNLFTLFAAELAKQSQSRLLDVREHDPDKVMEVPYWAWIDHQNEVAAILHAARGADHIKFIWPLIREHLSLCRCVFGAGEVEITPRCLPVTAIPSLGAAKRRIFMSATFSDDNVLVTDFDVPPAAVARAIAPTRANDLGDRMILVPQAFNTDISDAHVKNLIKELAKKWNAVVIVPSDYRAKFWADIAKLTLHANNLATGIQKLKDGHVGLVVLVNKYDGIDLPGDACRVLVIDGVPDVRKKVDRVDEAALWGSDRAVRRAIQRIEQGMGRGVRDIEDYCVVILMGSSLVSKLYVANAIELFTPGTRAQLRISEKLAKQLQGALVSDVREVALQCLKRDKGWVAASRGALRDVKHEIGRAVDAIAQAQRVAFNAASIRDYRAAVIALEAVANDEKDERIRGWLKQQVASYEHFRNPTQSQHILKAAMRLNPQLLRPVEGIEYERLSPLTVDQATGCIEYIRSKYSDPNGFVLDVKAVLDDLVFKPGTSNTFEQAMADVASLLGIRSQRPENDAGRGPDVLWATGGLTFFVIECKNGAVGATINKHDCDQLGGSLRWFESKYDQTCRRIPIIVHPVNVFEHHGTPPADTRVITAPKLEEFKEAVRKFSSSVARLDGFGQRDKVSEMLAHHRLTADELIAAFTVKYRVERST